MRLFLTRTELAETSALSDEEDLHITGGDEAILLVEDEEALRSLVRLVLQSYGYTVLEARDGQDGLWMAGQYPGTIHALVTDLVMPRMGGRELADHLVPHRPGLRVLFMSGHTDDPAMQRGEALAGAAFVQKPFSPLALARRVRQILDAIPKRSARGLTGCRQNSDSRLPGPAAVQCRLPFSLAGRGRQPVRRLVQPDRICRPGRPAD